jgi:hypothetical protein
MVVSIRQRKQYHYVAIVSGLALCMVICSSLLLGCATPPPDHALITSADTSIDQKTPIGSLSSQIIPIKVINTQTSVSTYPGGYMSLTISTSPFALCYFVVYYGLSAPSHSYGIIPHTANASGMVTWRWQVDYAAHRGTWPLVITAVLANGPQTSAKTNVNITAAPISVVSSQSNLTNQPGGDMVLTIATAPSIACMLLLDFGRSKPAKTLTARSDSNGIASWTWRIGDRAQQGVRPLTITAILADGTRSYAQVNMTIL